MKHATDATELSAPEPVTILGASADVKFDTGDKEESARALPHPAHFRWVLHQPARCFHTYHLNTGKHRSDYLAFSFPCIHSCPYFVFYIKTHCTLNMLQLSMLLGETYNLLHCDLTWEKDYR